MDTISMLGNWPSAGSTKAGYKLRWWRSLSFAAQLVLAGTEKARLRRGVEQPARTHPVDAHVPTEHLQAWGCAGAGAGKLDRAPCAARRPKPTAGLVAGGVERQASVPTVIVETGQGEGQAPARQGPAVVVAALRLVKRVAPAAREAFPHGGGDIGGELMLAGLGAPYGEHVLEPGPGLAPVGHRVLREPVGVRQHHVAPVARHRVGPHVVGQVAEIFDIVEPVDRGKRSFCILGVVDRCKPDHPGVSIAHELVNFAAVTDLELWVVGVLGPHVRVAQLGRHG
jgi:hypothetical protein